MLGSLEVNGSAACQSVNEPGPRRRASRKRHGSSTTSTRRGKRRLKTFTEKKEADSSRQPPTWRFGPVSIPQTASASRSPKLGSFGWKPVSEAGLERATLDAYRQHLRLHINPYLGNLKLSQLSAPMVREFEDKLARDEMPEGAKPEPRSPAMVRKVRTSLSALLSDAQARGLVSRNVVRELRRARKRGKERQAEKRQKGKLKVGSISLRAKRSGLLWGPLRAAGGPHYSLPSSPV